MRGAGDEYRKTSQSNQKRVLIAERNRHATVLLTMHYAAELIVSPLEITSRDDRPEHPRRLECADRYRLFG
jgi:hypothetical protein